MGGSYAEPRANRPVPKVMFFWCARERAPRPTAMPGYSRTPLRKKLGLASGCRADLVNVPAEVRAKLLGVLAASPGAGAARGPVDFVMVFAVSRPDLEREFERAERRLTPAGMLWACWPKKASGVVTDLHDELVREIGLRVGLVDVKVCAITETWSGLKFVRRRAERRHAA